MRSSIVFTVLAHTFSDPSNRASERSHFGKRSHCRRATRSCFLRLGRFMARSLLFVGGELSRRYSRPDPIRMMLASAELVMLMLFRAAAPKAQRR